MHRPLARLRLRRPIWQFLLWVSLGLIVLATSEVQAQRKGLPVDEPTEQPTQLALAEDLVRALVQQGFENVAAVSEDGHVIVAYENRRYRYEIRALQEVMKLVMPRVIDDQHVTLIPQGRGIPLVALTIPAGAYRSFMQGTMSREQFVATFIPSLGVDAFWRKTQASRKTNPSFFKFDLVIHPQFSAQFGNYDDAVKSQVNIAPELTTSFWKGMRLSAQMIIPIQNELAEEGNYLRPGLLTLNQTLRLPYNTFVSTTAGYFTLNRYGIDAAFKKYFAGGRWALGANVGYTGEASFRKGQWLYTDPDVLTPSVSIEYYLPQYNLTARTTYGKFIFEDTGFRVDVLREFGEFKIGFFGLLSKEINNAGFNLVLPLFVRKYSKPAHVRIRPARTFSWEYRYRGLPLTGRRYETGNSIDTFKEGLTPSFIKNHLTDLHNW